MENPAPETLVSFLNSILEAETQSDLWKSKLFCIFFIDIRYSDRIIFLINFQSKLTSRSNIDSRRLKQYYKSMPDP